MSEPIHPARQLRRAEMIFDIASRRAAELGEERSLWQWLSCRRFSTLAGILSLLEEASEMCREAGTDAESPLATAIRELHTGTRRQLRNIGAAYGVIVALFALLLAAAVYLAAGVIASDGTPSIADPTDGAVVDMTISVSGSSPRRLRSGTNLYLLVKPQGFDYWLQPLPEVSSTGWRVEHAGIGTEGNDGMHFDICAILIDQTLLEGWHSPDLPPGLSRCIGVTRK
jgi:hypothetical protein